MSSQIIPYSDSYRQPQHFDFNGFRVTIEYDREGNPWFDGPAVCKSIGIAKPSVAYSRLDNDEKQPLSQIKGTPPQNGVDRVYVSESGLYNLILRSDKPEAKAFKKHVTSVVLPSIRRTGSYSTHAPSSLDLLEGMVKELRSIDDRIRRIEARQNVQDQVNNYFTIQGYAQYLNRHIDDTAAALLGKWATKYCKANSVHIGSAKDARYGKLNSYPEDVLAVVFHAWRTQQPLFDE